MNYKEMIVSSYEAASNSELGGNKKANEKNYVGKAEDLKSSNDDCRQEREHEQEKQLQQEQQDQQQGKKKEHGEQQAGKDNEEDDEHEEEQLEQNCSQTIESTISSLQSSVIVQSPVACNSTETTFIAPNSPSSSSSTSKNNGDSTFEPTVDMMVNDFDDEQTLEEEEALAAQECEDPTAELSNLQKESDMPIEELLALYNFNGAAMMHMNENRNKKTAKSSGSGYNKRKLKPQRMISSSSSNHDCNEENDVGDNCGSGDRNSGVSGDQIMSGEHNDEEDEDDDDDIDEGDDEDDDDDDDDNLKDSQLRKLYPETYGNSNDKRLLRTISRQQSDEEDDGEYSPDEDELKKTIMVGSEFQAVIPEGFSKYDDALPYENEDKLLWDPSNYNEMETEEYLQNSKALNIANNDNVPGGNHLRDDEQALYLLLQCGYNPVEALRRKRLNTVPSSSDEMSIWSEEECRNFESGVRVYGKDFYTIKHTKVRTRSVGELVQFYYLWKKTERHDVFANKARLEKKKYSLHPGLTDYMDRFLEEQDTNNGNTSNSNTMMNLRDRSSSPAVVNSLLQADTKRLKIHHHNQSSLSSSYHHHHHYHGSSSNSLIGSSNNSNEKIMNRMSSASTSSMIPTTSTATTSTTIISKDNDNNINLLSSTMTTTATNNSCGSTNNNRSQSSSLLSASASSSSSLTTAATAKSSSSSSLSASNQDGGNSNAS